MGGVAPAAPADAHFFQHVFAALEKVHLRTRVGLRSGDGCEKSRRPAADDGYLHSE
jgi:hypothetical protein